MLILKARAIIEVDPDSLWDIIYGKEIQVLFDDGGKRLSASEIILSAYAWQLIAHYPNTPLLMEDNVTEYYKNGIARRAMHLNLMQDIMSRVFDTYNIHDRKVVYRIVKLIAMINNKLYNKLYLTTMRYMVSSSILDSLHLLRHPDMVDLHDSLFDIELDQEIVSEKIAASTKLLVSDMKNPDGTVNGWSWMATRGLIKPVQLSATIFMRGYVTDTDRSLIPHVIINGYLRGMRTYRDYMVCARENAVAVRAQEDELRSASTDSRRMTYAASYVRDVIPGDCGSTETIPLLIDSLDYLNVVVGSYYHREGQPPVRITKNHTHLIGTVVNLRTSLGCRVTPASVSCSICNGDLSLSIPDGVNVGSDIAKTIHQWIVQMKLSKKHYLQSSDNSGEDGLSSTFKKLFKEDTHLRGVTLRPTHWRNAVEIHIEIPAGEYNSRLMTCLDVEDVNFLTLSQVSMAAEIYIKIVRPRSVIERGPIATTKMGIRPMLSYSVLDFLNKKHRLEGDTRIRLKGDVYVIDLTGFDFNNYLLKRPNKAPDEDESNRFLMGLYERTGDGGRSLSDNILETVSAIIERSIAGNLGVSLSSIITILSAYICKEDSYSLARGLLHTRHESATRVLTGRSLSMYLMLKDQNKIISEAGSYLIRERDDNTILDYVIDPVGAMKVNRIKPWYLQDLIADRLKEEKNANM